jgi:ribosome-associated heat shock protein Hsp15
MMEAVRIDKWLWAARFYKTRSLAAQAANGGKIHLNGVRVKPARVIKIGDELKINRQGFTYLVKILALSEHRGPAKIAESLYEESKESVQKRNNLAEQHKLAAATAPHPDRKPDKKARRQLRDLKW